MHKTAHAVSCYAQNRLLRSRSVMGLCPTLCPDKIKFQVKSYWDSMGQNNILLCLHWETPRLSFAEIITVCYLAKECTHLCSVHVQLISIFKQIFLFSNAVLGSGRAATLSAVLLSDATLERVICTSRQLTRFALWYTYAGWRQRMSKRL